MTFDRTGISKEVLTLTDISAVVDGEHTSLGLTLAVSGTIENDVIIAISADIQHEDSMRNLVKQALMRAREAIDYQLEWTPS